jgi:hypothetical protein
MLLAHLNRAASFVTCALNYKAQASGTVTGQFLKVSYSVRAAPSLPRQSTSTLIFLNRNQAFPE